MSRGVVGGLRGGAGRSVCPGFTHWRHPSPSCLLAGRFDASSRLGYGPHESVQRPVGRRGRAAEPQPCHSRAGLTSIGLEARIPHRSPRQAPIAKRWSEHGHARDKVASVAISDYVHSSCGSSGSRSGHTTCSVRPRRKHTMRSSLAPVSLLQSHPNGDQAQKAQKRYPPSRSQG